MNIVLSADPFLPVPPRLYGGIERVVALLLRHYRAAGHQVLLLAHPDSTEPADRLVPWPSEGSGVWGHLGNAGAMRSAVRHFEADVVHSFSRLLYLLRARDLPALMCFQREPTARTIRLAHRLAGPRLQFSGCSEYIAGRGRPAGGTWHAVPNAVDCASITVSAEVPEDAPLVFLSRVEPIKGAHVAIDIARRAGRRLIIAGNRAESGRDAAYFDQEIAPQLDSQIEYVGPVDDAAKQALLGAAAAMLVPIQWNEPFGIVFVEALACGTPVITCPRGAAPEIIEPGRHGFLIRDAAEGVAAVQQLETVSREACRRRAESAFDAPVVARRYLDILEALAS
ncbi:MAG: glycosyltransferase [Pseudomonadota bacterium]